MSLSAISLLIFLLTNEIPLIEVENKSRTAKLPNLS